MKRRCALLYLVFRLINAGFLLAQTSNNENGALLRASSLPIYLNPGPKYGTSLNQVFLGLYGKPWAQHLYDTHTEEGHNFFGDVLSVLPTDRIAFKSSVGFSRSRNLTNGVQEAWVSHYASENAPGHDWAADIAVDDAGNVYITGYSYNTPYEADYFTAKYDPAGNLIWTAYYNGTSNGGDHGTAIDLDSQGNVYVAGESKGIGRNDDYVTIKYSSDGVEQWVARYDGPGSPSDRATALLVDDMDNIYVTGGSPASGSSTGFATIKYNPEGVEQWVVQYHDPNKFAGVSDMTIDDNRNVYLAGSIDHGQGVNADYLTIKYDSSGVEQWRATYDAPANRDDYANAIFVDAAGSVYVTGRSRGMIGIYGDYATIKYDNSGNEQWIARYNGPITGGAWANDLIVDESGNVYVTGRSEGEDSGADFLTLKYDADGRQIWQARYNNGGNNWGPAIQIELDQAGNIYVAGSISVGLNNVNYTTIKYNSNGIKQWETHYDGAGSWDYPTAMTVGDDQNVYITGSSEGSATGYDCATIKYSSNGVEQWVSRYNKEGNSNDSPVDVTFDDFGNVYVVGTSEVAGSGKDYLAVKYNGAGAQEWIARYNGPVNDHDEATTVAVDNLGNLYVTGRSDGVDSGADYLTVKYNPAGDEIWVARYDAAKKSDLPKAIAVDQQGNVYITGASYNVDEDRNSNEDYTTIKYNSEGNEEWVARYDGPAHGGDGAVDIAVDGSGNVLVTGGSVDQVGDITTIKYDRHGRTEWIRRYKGSTQGNGGAEALVLDAKGNVYITGWSEGEQMGRDIATIKYDKNGSEVWVARYDGPMLSFVWPEGIAVDGKGNVFVMGNQWTNFAEEYQYLVVKYNPSGEQLWVQTNNGFGEGSSLPADLALDGFGNVYVTGRTFSISSQTDFYTVKYDPDGEEQWIASYNLPQNTFDEATAMAVDGWGTVYVTGRTGGWSGYMTTIKYTQDEYLNRERTFNMSQSYPNPFNGSTTIRYRLENSSEVRLKIHNLLGQEIETLINKQQLSGEYEVAWHARNAPSGTYIYRLQAKDITASGRDFVEVRKLVLLK